jgi:hypothetical protein
VGEFAWENFTNGNQVLFMDPYLVYQRPAVGHKPAAWQDEGSPAEAIQLTGNGQAIFADLAAANLQPTARGRRTLYASGGTSTVACDGGSAGRFDLRAERFDTN